MPEVLIFDKVNNLKPNFIVRWGLFTMIIIVLIAMLIAWNFDCVFQLAGECQLKNNTQQGSIIECMVDSKTLNRFGFEMMHRKVSFTEDKIMSQKYSGKIIGAKQNLLLVKMDSIGNNTTGILNGSLFRDGKKKIIQISIEDLNLFQILSLKAKSK
ncbi:hypothetical protein LX99_04538 [Mucilaginibacter oryzae]|uniref:Uncharacterized protein n=1 Tax=Mucilaginibacter oryzae TaxID=468058 RepID=A0A316H190_9SPHI|nr:hypothetical protein [Mucilaginibacter oryzae]PWK70831.1 hypothetical protein LX99_04538 [Mucilaginibacter oryzae]